ncbi:MAG: hypothetical protein LBT62_05745, partial [Deltaproteobacteria bacterium]|nr:hypothetical protein [Deltaproteobacteria bacterium]
INWAFPPTEGLLSQKDFSQAVFLASFSFRERLAANLNREVSRYINSIDHWGLPPWYKIRLAGFFRRLASSGYPPLEDQMAFYRLSLDLLDQAAKEFPLFPEPSSKMEQAASLPSETSLMLADKGLVLAEMSLIAPNDAAYLVGEAHKLWDLAEADSPGSSRYARARLAAWGGDEEEIAPLLSHTAQDQDFLLWPSFSEAAFEPAFKKIYQESWFKTAWFGYGNRASGAD